MKIEVTNEAVLELAAQKIADEFIGENYSVQEAVDEKIQNFVDSQITDELRATIKDKIEAALDAEMTRILDAEIIPVDIWGEGRGEPTSIRAQLHKRCLSYWEEKVELDRLNSGRYRVTTYGGTPRAKLVFQHVCKEAFDEAMRENVNEIVAAFRNALAKDAAKSASEHIDRLIKVPTKRR